MSVVRPVSGFARLSGKQHAQKRAFDVIVALVLLAILSPLLLLVSALVRFSSEGPVLFRQPRIGFLGEPFICFKFRTMFEQLCDVACERQVTDGDARVTPIGRWLRRMSLDELPQLFNVLRGDMSLVGPRPHAPATKVGDVPFHQALANYGSRHGVLPGITGLAQVRGFRGRTATMEDLRGRVELDLDYISRWSLLLDLKILAATVHHLVTHGEVY